MITALKKIDFLIAYSKHKVLRSKRTCGLSRVFFGEILTIKTGGVADSLKKKP
jgi:hypothetical protein